MKQNNKKSDVLIEKDFILIFEHVNINSQWWN